MEEIKKLQILFEYYENLKKKRDSGKMSFSPYLFDLHSINDYMFRKAVEVFGFDGKPKVVSEKEFEQISSDCFYHGFEEFEYGRNFLQDKEYHTGTGDETVGLYSTKSYDEAMSYTSSSRYGDDDENKILKFKFVEDRAVISSEQLFKYHSIVNTNLDSEIYDFLINELPKTHQEKIKVLVKFISEIKNEYLQKDFYEIMTEDALLSAYLGFDMLILSKFGFEKYYIVLNRGAMVVEDSAVKRFEEGARLEQNQPQ